jgi:ABC-type amino acid transport substrate-binding protein
LAAVIVFYSDIEYGIGHLVTLPGFRTLQHREDVKGIKRARQLSEKAQYLGCAFRKGDMEPVVSIFDEV